MNYNELELIELTKQGNNDALSQLTSLHSGILHNIIKSYSLPYKALANFQEFFSDRFEIVYNAAKTWTPERAAFNTHCGTSAKFHCLRQMKKLINKDEANCENEELILNRDSSAVHLDKSDEDISDYLNLLDDERTIQVFKLRYEENFTWHQIGKVMGFSHYYGQILHNSGLELIKRRMNCRLKELL